MGSEIITGAFLLFVGFFISFLSSTISSLSTEYLNLKQNESADFKRLYEIKLLYSDKSNAFFVFEILFYFLSFFMFNVAFEESKLNPINSMILFIFIFVAFFLVRTLIYSVGIRSAIKVCIKLLPFIKVLSVINLPVVNLINLTNQRIGGKNTDEASREELSSLVESAHEEGSIEASEYRLLKNIMKFNEVFVSDVMTPRTVVFSLDADLTISEVLSMTEIKMYSRIPVYEGDSLDEGIVGYLLSKDILFASLNGKNDLKLRELIRKVQFIPENVELENALEQLLKDRQHLLIVVDEYGGVDGLITMEDVLETILGVEIVDEADRIVDLRELAKRKRDNRIAERGKINN